MHPTLQALQGGDRRSSAQSNVVVKQMLDHPALFEVLVSGMRLDDALLRMRCADAAEKIRVTKARGRTRLVACIG